MGRRAPDHAYTAIAIEFAAKRILDDEAPKGRRGAFVSRLLYDYECRQLARQKGHEDRIMLVTERARQEGVLAERQRIRALLLDMVALPPVEADGE
jgi:hypothetical protein